MTHKIKNLLLIYCFAITFLQTNAQWEIFGNTINNTEWMGADPNSEIPVRFQHHANIGALSRFEWHTNLGGTVAERMRLTHNGFLGLNTTAPLARYHQNLGDMLVTGLLSHPTTATVPLPALTVGDRLMWIESRGALRAGGVTTANPDAWDAANIGLRSAVLGQDSEAIGTASVALGGGCRASGENSMAFGGNCTASNGTSIAIGNGCTATLAGDVAIGNNNNVNGGNSYALGQNNSITATSAYSIGFANSISNTFCGALGYSINLSAPGSYGLGCFLNGTAANSIIIGNGINAATPIVNNSTNSLMVGFNSTHPTLYVSGGNGTPGTFGNVGIGLDASTAALTPSERLDVNGNARFRTLPVTTPNCVILGENVSGGGGAMDNRLTRLNLNGNTSSYFAGNGTWQAIPTSLCDWNIVNGGLDLAMGYTIGLPPACVPGNVGIGVQPASNARLDIYYNAAAFSDSRHAINSSMVGGSFFNFGNRVALQSFGPPYALENYGFHSYTKGANKNYAGNFNAIATSNTNSNFGIYSFADGGTWNNVNYALYGRATGGGTTYGIYAMAAGGLSNWAGYFNGRVKITDYLDVAGTIYTSDEALKTNIQPIEGSLEKLLTLTAISYSWNQNNILSVELPDGASFGYTAQQVQEVFPEIVNEMSNTIVDDEGNPTGETTTHLGIRYVELIPHHTVAIQELNAKVVALEEQYASCCSDVKSFNSPSPDHELNLTLQNGEKAILGLATPNPNDGNVNINIYLPQNITAVVEVLFTDALGQPVQIAEVTERGNVQLNINTVNLSSGTYQYTLIIDGIVEATRKMVRK